MKRIGLILFLVVLAGACVKETPVTSPVSTTRNAGISFMTATYTPATKTDTPFTGNVYPTTEQFGVFAFTLNPDNNIYGNTTNNNNCTPDLMKNDGVKWYDTPTSKWLPIKDFYWPKKNRVAFFAYSPFYPYLDNKDVYTGYSEYSNTRRSAYYVKGNGNKYFYQRLEGVEIGNTLHGGKNDLLFSDIALNFNDYADASDSDLIYDGTTGVSGTDHGYAGVPILFRHAFCQVSICAKLSKDTEGGPDSPDKEHATVLTSLAGELPYPSVGNNVDETHTEGKPADQTSVEHGSGEYVVTTIRYITRVETYSQIETTTKIWGAKTYTGEIDRFVLGQVAYDNRTRANLTLRSYPIENPSDASHKSTVVQWDLEGHPDPNYPDDPTKDTYRSFWEFPNKANPPQDMTVENVTITTTEATLPGLYNRVMIPLTPSYLSNSTINIKYSITTVPVSKEVLQQTNRVTVTKKIKRTVVRHCQEDGFNQADPATWTDLSDPVTTEELEEDPVYNSVAGDIVASTVIYRRGDTEPNVGAEDAGYNTSLTFETGDISLEGLGGIYSWDIGKRYKYVFTIVPRAGARINWDPAVVTSWTASPEQEIPL